MKKLFAAALVAVTTGLWACGPADNTNPDAGTQPDAGVQPDAGHQAQTIEVNEDISADTTWISGNTYVLQKHVFVKSGTLKIEEGVTVKGGLGTSLVVTSNGKIDAVGTSSAPIIFTSEKPEGERSAGDWGGVVLLGKAPINVASGTNKIEGLVATVENEPFITYGGTDNAHDCGTLKYARIEFAGYELSQGNELNGLTVGGCGTGTDLDFIQVHLGADDGVEFFGGSAGIKHLVVTQADDDALDWDLGWTGKGQFLIIQQNAIVGNMGFESDNNSTDKNASPLSKPELWNVTMIGSNAAPGAAGKTQKAMHAKNGTAGQLNNFIIAYFADGLIDVDGTDAVARVESGDLAIRNSLFWENGDAQSSWPTGDDDAKDGAFDEGAAFMAASLANEFADPKLVDALNLTAPNFAPASGSPALSGGATPPAGFDSSATFRGAIGTVDWTAGWTAYPEM